MIDISEYDFGNNISLIDTMNENDAKEYFEDLEADYWIEEYKNNILI